MGAEDTIQAVERSFEVVETLLELDGAGVTTLADHLDMSVSGTYKHLATIRGLDYVRKRNGEYEVTYEFYSLGEHVRSKDPLYEVGRTPLDELSRLTFARSNLYARDGERVTCLYSTSGGQDISTDSTEGRTVPVHDHVAGRVMLTDEERRELRGDEADGSESGLTVVNDHRVGIATEEDHRRIAIAIVGSERAIGSIEVSAPADQIEGRMVEEDILSMLVSTTETIESHL